MGRRPETLLGSPKKRVSTTSPPRALWPRQLSQHPGIPSRGSGRVLIRARAPRPLVRSIRRLRSEGRFLDAARMSARDANGGVPVVWQTKRRHPVAKGIERGKKDNKPKLSTKEKQKKKKEKNASRTGITG
jgi:hypothetical protein